VSIYVRGKPNWDANRSLPVAIAISDDDGNEHRIRLTLRGRGIPASSKPISKMEVPAKITDPIEKDVASILQAEIARYNICERSVGGLGSFHLSIGGQPLNGVGNDAWRNGVPTNQLVKESELAVSMHSDNLDSMMTLYSRLSPNGQRSFSRSLLHRLKTTEMGYARVAYFIFLSLWQIGEFNEALSVAKHSLPSGDTKDFGLSNIMMLLNGLLGHDPKQFSDEMLDQIEQFIDGSDEHKFLIAEKIVTIRAMRQRTT
jgi:hypothetical protein